MDEETTQELPLVDGEIVERINMAELKPLFDTDHEHIFVADPTDQTDGYSVEMCSVNGCGLGRSVAK